MRFQNGDLNVLLSAFHGLHLALPKPSHRLSKSSHCTSFKKHTAYLLNKTKIYKDILLNSNREMAGYFVFMLFEARENNGSYFQLDFENTPTKYGMNAFHWISMDECLYVICHLLL